VSTTHETKAQRQARLRAEAERLNAAAEQAWGAYDGLLAQGLGIDHRLNIASMRSMRPFAEAPPAQPVFQPQPPPPDPARASSIFGRLSESVSPENARARFAREQAEWPIQCQRIAEANARAHAAHQAAMYAYHERWRAHEARRVQVDGHIDRLEHGYAGGDPDAVELYCGIVLDKTPYPLHFPHGGSVEFSKGTSTLVCERPLPPLALMPKVAHVRYVASRDEFDQDPPTEKEKANWYGGIICRIAIRTLYEIFQGEWAGHVQAVVFNGTLETTDRSTGHPAKCCIASVRAERSAFGQLNLAKVLPVACFNGLDGRLTSPLLALKPIEPFAEFRGTEKA